ncbi:MAG TPA: hypothetical protein VMW52_02650 [Phycisphaerae bacterium]|nr:hypothetical protein [Phycisphaerae bacterium]
MVYRDCGDSVGLLFGFDRFNEPQDAQCAGVELWAKDELDLSSVEE